MGDKFLAVFLTGVCVLMIVAALDAGFNQHNGLLTAAFTVLALVNGVNAVAAWERSLRSW